MSGSGTEIELRLVSGAFTDEVTGKDISISSKNPLRTCISGFIIGASLSNIAITPITTLACEIADYLIESGMGVAEAFTKANREIVNNEIVSERHIFIPNENFSQLDIINTLPALYPPSIPSNFDDLDPSTLYTLLIVGLSQEAKNIADRINKPFSVMEFLALLKIDASDGIFDGAKGVDPISFGGNGGGGSFRRSLNNRSYQCHTGSFRFPRLCIAYNNNNHHHNHYNDHNVYKSSSSGELKSMGGLGG